MSTYVINNRIPKFPIKEGYADRSGLQKRLEDAFQIWLKEAIVSNLTRRKACSQLYDFSRWLDAEGLPVESQRPDGFAVWCAERRMHPQLDWGDFLRYARNRLPELRWEEPSK